VQGDSDAERGLRQVMPVLSSAQQIQAVGKANDILEQHGLSQRIRMEN
jgi:phosphopentomutase